jgi:hypothetical protein
VASICIILECITLGNVQFILESGGTENYWQPRLSIENGCRTTGGEIGLLIMKEIQVTDMKIWDQVSIKKAQQCHRSWITVNLRPAMNSGWYLSEYLIYLPEWDLMIL